MKLHSLSPLNLGIMMFSGVGLATCLPATATTLYSVTELSTPDINVIPYGINNLGQVVGSYFSSSIENIDNQRAFRTSPNSPVNPATDDLGTSGYALSINDLGQVAGTSFHNGNQAFRISSNRPFNPVTDSLSDYYSDSNGINNLGQALVLEPSRQSTASYRTAPNSPLNRQTDNIGTLGGMFPDMPFGILFTSDASDINDLGQVVGTSLNISLEDHAFRTAPNSAINPATDDLGTLGGSLSRASAINNLGQVVGFSTNASGETHAFLTAPNSAINPATDDLGTLGGSQSEAFDVNNLGQVVGNSTTASREQRAFIYDNGQIFDLNNLIPSIPGLTLNYARAINDRGQIVAGSSILSERERAFLLTPIVSTPVPESSFGLGVLAFAALGTGFLPKSKQKIKQ